MSAAAPGRGAVVITGASTGIGRACAMRLDGAGFHVFAGVRRDQDGQALKEAASGELTPLHIDVTDTRSIDYARGVVAEAVGEGGLAGLVNNAGIGRGGPMELLPLEDVREVMEVNYLGQVAVTQAFLPLLRRAQGRVVNMSSIAGRFATPFLGPYTASKHALEAFSYALRVELQPWGMHVAVIEPGSIDTPIWGKALEAADDMEEGAHEETLALYRRQIDALRETVEKFAAAGIDPDDVAKRVEHALTASRPKARYLVGRDARLQAFIQRWAPTRLRDRLIRREMGL